MNIIQIASEMAPFSKTGGLGDVTAALPKELAENDLDVFAFTPFYRFIKTFGYPIKKMLETDIKIGEKTFSSSLWYLSSQENPAIFFIEQEELFQDKIYTGEEIDSIRFYFFDIAALKYIEMLGLKPDVIHCHDWQSGLIPNFIKDGTNPFFKDTATVFTMHNLAFQKGGSIWDIPPDKQYENEGLPPDSPEEIRYVNFMRRAIRTADVLNTVSEQYAEEILTPEFGKGLEKELQKRKGDLFGIINGIDTNIFNPATDENLYKNYSWWSIHFKKENKRKFQEELGLEQNDSVPLIAAVNRLTYQKGFDLIKNAFEEMMEKDLQLVILGVGSPDYMDYFEKIQESLKGKFKFIHPFSEEMELKLLAASDLLLMPSRFEPCGLAQLKSLRYGSIPIVHSTGGLADTVEDFHPAAKTGNGFVFYDFTKEKFLETIDRALGLYQNHSLWHSLSVRAMRQVFSWELPAKKYVELYELAISKKQELRIKNQE